MHDTPQDRPVRDTASATVTASGNPNLSAKRMW